MKKLSLNLSSFFVILIFIISNSYSSEKNVAIGKAQIIDGDTIIIKGEKIRFAGIDTPERNKIGHNFSKIKLKKKNRQKYNCMRKRAKFRSMGQNGS